MTILETRGLSRSFGGLHAVENVSTKIADNEIFGIIGPNGAGKTTFLNLCGGACPVTSGDILFFDKRITNLPSYKIAKMGIMRTFQNIKLFDSMTVLDNVRAGFHICEDAGFFDALIRTKKFKTKNVELENRTIELLQTLDLLKYKNTVAKNLSYGLKRKVEIARALASKPKLLLLDEPVAGMNPVETKSLLNFIVKIRDEGYTIAVIEHDIKFMAELCDRIMVLDYGKKICEDTAAKVYRDARVIEAYFGKGNRVREEKSA
jgi:branched-chain amino acid transport system ATP-binding protein